MTKIKRFGWTRQDFYDYVMLTLELLAEKEAAEILKNHPKKTR